MAHVSKGLFDPRVKFQHWPEPNDDPNIPYAWGESGLGYALNGYRSNEGDAEFPFTEDDIEILDDPTAAEAQTLSDKKTELEAVEKAHKELDTIVKPIPSSKSIPDDDGETTIAVVAATSIVLGVWGLVDGYSQSTNQGGERIFDSLEKGVIYATGIGFIFNKLGKG
jgi:hypothetical protein